MIFHEIDHLKAEISFKVPSVSVVTIDSTCTVFANVLKAISEGAGARKTNEISYVYFRTRTLWLQRMVVTKIYNFVHFRGSSKLEEATELYVRSANTFKMAKKWGGKIRHCIFNPSW